MTPVRTRFYFLLHDAVDAEVRICVGREIMSISFIFNIMYEAGASI